MPKKTIPKKTKKISNKKAPKVEVKNDYEVAFKLLYEPLQPWEKAVVDAAAVDSKAGRPNKRDYIVDNLIDRVIELVENPPEEVEKN